MDTKSTLKDKMKMPPDINKPSPRSHHAKNRTRIRLEVLPQRAEWLMGLIDRELKGMDITSDEFGDAYQIYTALREQMKKKTEKPKL